MAAELNLPPQPRTGATPPAEQDRPRPTSSETESEKEDKNEGDDLNIYDQIIKRDT